MPHIALLMIQIAAVVVTGRLLGRALRALGQPSVIAEVLAGILLGPSLFGLVWPEGMAALFPAEGMAALSLISQLGLVFFMFLVGLEFDPGLLQGRGHQSVVISHASIIAPFALGGLIAWPLHPILAPPGVPLLPFGLFMGAAMSVTAFPVLARILAERGVLRTRLGAITLSCAAVDDVTAWCILAFVVSVARAEGVAPALATTGMSLVFIAVMLWVVRPALRRLGPRQGQGVSADTVAVAFLLLLMSATATEWIGIHALFGAFLLGAVMPRGGGFTQAITEKIEDFVTIILLPLFFAFSGLRTRIGLLATPQDWLICGLIVLVACLGKFGGSALAARAVGLSWREAGAIGILMNTRGLMELIVLNMGLDLGILSPQLFTMMVVMALVTTWMTSPLLERFYPRREMLQSLAPAPAPPVSPAPAPTLICVSDPALIPALLSIGSRLAPPGEPLLALHILSPDRPSAYLAAPPGGESGPLESLRAQAAALGVPIRTISFVSSDPAQDIARLSQAKGAGLILIGGHRAALAADDLSGALAGVVGGVLAAASAPVGVFIDRGSQGWRAVRAAGDDPDVRAVASRLQQSMSAADPADPADPDGPDTLVVAPVGAPVPAGASALWIRAGRAG